MQPPRIRIRVQLLDEHNRITDTYDTGRFDVASLDVPDPDTQDQFYAEVAHALRTLADNVGQGRVPWEHSSRAP